jgi:hypothetical protein
VGAQRGVASILKAGAPQIGSGQGGYDRAISRRGQLILVGVLMVREITAPVAV